MSADAYFSADVETDGPIPGPYSILSFALVYAGSFDGIQFARPDDYTQTFYRELRPVSDQFQDEALGVNGLNRSFLCSNGKSPDKAMLDASRWVRQIAGGVNPVIVAYPLSFDWTWLYWYFVQFSSTGFPFDYSRCFDVKTALAVKGRLPISQAGRSRLPSFLLPKHHHTHNALDDAVEQAEIFANVFEWEGCMHEFEQRRAGTLDRIDTLRKRLVDAEQIIADRACVYVTGSFGRLEASDHSDLDLFIVSKNKKGPNQTVVSMLPPSR